MTPWGKGIEAEFWGMHGRCLVKAEGVAQKEAVGECARASVGCCGSLLP